MRIIVAVLLTLLALARTDFAPDKIGGELIASDYKLDFYDYQSILSQPFHYLAKGRQSFVFESEDKKWVIKFFNTSYFTMPWYSFIFPKEANKRARRKFFYENSYSIAAREMGEEIAYLHLGEATLPLPVLQVTDRANRVFAIPLREVPFVLQKKAIPLYTVLQKVYKKEGCSGLCQEIDTFASLIKARIQKGIADADSDVEHNWGYVDDKIVHIDPGRLYYDPSLSTKERIEIEWKRATRDLHKWLTQLCPDAAFHLEQYARKN